jgi:hypothetical protein
MDRKQLKLRNQSAGAELYKGDNWGGAVMLDYVPDLPGALMETWGGWEMQSTVSKILLRMQPMLNL